MLLAMLPALKPTFLILFALSIAAARRADGAIGDEVDSCVGTRWPTNVHPITESRQCKTTRRYGPGICGSCICPIIAFAWSLQAPVTGFRSMLHRMRAERPCRSPNPSRVDEAFPAHVDVFMGMWVVPGFQA